MGGAITQNQVAVVGASRGIGLEWSRQLLAKGNQVFATSRSPSKGLEELRKQHEKQLSLAQAWCRELKAATQALDVVVVNAGVASGEGLGGVHQDHMLSMFCTNAVGPLLVAQQLMEAGLLKRGSILANMTSKMGSMDDNGSGGYYAYRASKAALNAITKSLSLDLERQGVTCLVLHPGYVRTDMTGHSGLINVDQSVSGLIGVLEGKKALNGKFFDYKGVEVPW